MQKNKIKPIIAHKQTEEMKIMIQVGKFSLNILHDLVNPITGLTLYLENTKDEQIKNVLKPITQANDAIRNFIKTIQNTVGKPDYTELIDIEEIIKSSMILSKHKSKINNVAINYSRNISGLNIKMNKLDLYQILLNLTGNSIDSFSDADSKRYIKERKVVSISLSENIKHYRLSIIDNGSGIKKSIQNKIFLKNFTTKKSGFGIGLNTINEIINKKLKGYIKVKSKWGEGTKFHLYFPKSITERKLNS